ncbi:MAG: DEAD/DEAH box helicase [Candidatus Asgardarchaeia archaeon]
MPKYFTYPLIKPNTVEYRVYQEIIAAVSSRKNTLVVLPTGLGKTIIAALVIAHRLNRYPESKVIFLAPTRPLVEQHKKTLTKILDIPPEEINVFTGHDNPDKRIKKWGLTKVAIMTPQVLQNDIIAKRYSLSDVSLIIFDECHRAVGDYPYVFIAKKYMNEAKNPLILGITASPGSEIEKIEEIKNNLFIQQVEVRDEYSPDVAPYVQRRKLKWYLIDLPPEFAKIIKLLNEQLKEHLKVLREHGFVETTDPRSVKRTDLIQAKDRLQGLISSGDEISSDYYSLLGIVTNAIRISHLLELIETQGVSSFYAHLIKLEKKANRSGAPRTLKEFVSTEAFSELKALSNLLVEKEIEHPKLTKLIEILSEFLGKNPNSRVLVFTHYRVTAKFIAEKLNESGFNAMWFIGQQKRLGIKGLTQKQQIEILDKFSAGEYNILVATSVAEEGLDIAECDLVIFYDAVPSAVRRIQRMGRTGRKHEGNVIVLIAKGTRDEGYYWASLRKEKKMKEILQKLKKQLSAKEIERSKIAFDKAQMDLERYISSSNSSDRSSLGSQKLSTETEEQIEIIVDSREFSSEVVRYLSDYNCRITIKRLPVGDYIISDNVVIERKTSSDFVDSIIDRRLFNQVKDLKVYKTPILLIEGTNLFSHRNVNPNAIRAALISLAIDFNIPIIWSSSPKESADIIFTAARREQIEHKRTPTIRAASKPILDDEILEFIVAGIPGVDLSRARQLLSHFKTLKSLFNADIDKLKRVPGIGEKLAERIFRLANYEFGSNQKVKKDDNQQ